MDILPELLFCIIVSIIFVLFVIICGTNWTDSNCNKESDKILDNKITQELSERTILQYTNKDVVIALEKVMANIMNEMYDFENQCGKYSLEHKKGYYHAYCSCLNVLNEERQKHKCRRNV